MITIHVALTLLIPDASACSMAWYAPDPGLPGMSAGPAALFTVTPGSEVLDEADVAVPVERMAFRARGVDMELLIPAEPLAAGMYRKTVCIGEECQTEIVLDGDHEGAPSPPEIVGEERDRQPSGRWSNCGPSEAVTHVTAETDGVGVIIAHDPVDELAGADLVDVFLPGEDGLVWTADEDAELVMASIDAEGDLSLWVPLSVEVAGCSAVPGSTHGAALLAAMALAMRRRRAEFQAR